MKTRYKILVTPTSIKPDSKSDALDALKAFAGELVYNPTGKPLAERDLLKLLKGCDGVVAGLDDYSGEVIRLCANYADNSNADANTNADAFAGVTGGYLRQDGKLKVISRYGSGYDNVDLASARDNGVVVCKTPGANAQAVADLAFGLMLCCARRLPMLDRGTKSGEWPRSTGIELYGKTIGILGLGAVGKGVAKRASGFSMRVLATYVAPDMEFARTHGIYIVSFDELISASDFISLHLPLNPVTRRIINRDALNMFKPGAILVNTARGGLIDEDAAYEALISGRLGGLGLDAYEEEPPKVSPLFGLDNVALTPHTGSHTLEATRNLAQTAVNNLIDVLSGRPCRYAVII